MKNMVSKHKHLHIYLNNVHQNVNSGRNWGGFKKILLFCMLEYFCNEHIVLQSGQK